MTARSSYTGALMPPLTMEGIERTLAEFGKLPRIPRVELRLDRHCGELRVLRNYPQPGDLLVLIDPATFGDWTARALAAHHRPEGLP
jgi:hypothetical protein